MQFALEESILSRILTDVDEPDIGQWPREERFDPGARGGIERVERAVYHQPLWPLQTDSREGHTLLFVFGQAPVPTIGRPEKRLEVLQTYIRERTRDDCLVIGGGRAWVSDRGAQRSRWDIGTCRQEHHCLARRARDAAASPWPDPDDCVQQECSCRTVFSHDERAVTWLHLHVRLTQSDCAVSSRNREIVDTDRVALRFLQVDAVNGPTETIHRHHRSLETGNP